MRVSLRDTLERSSVPLLILLLSLVHFQKILSLDRIDILYAKHPTARHALSVSGSELNLRSTEPSLFYMRFVRPISIHLDPRLGDSVLVVLSLGTTANRPHHRTGTGRKSFTKRRMSCQRK